MPRPITDNDVKNFKKPDNFYKFKYHKHPKLGWWLHLTHTKTYNPKPRWELYLSRASDKRVYSYSLDRNGTPVWCTIETILRRIRKGHPGPRRKPKKMKDIAIFTMEEIELANEIIEDME